MALSLPNSEVLDCSYCGNRTPHALANTYEHSMLFDEIDFGDGRRESIHEPYHWISYQCGTCGGLNLYGGFLESDSSLEDLRTAKLYPKGSNLLPPSHMMEPSKPIPERVLRIYEEVWPLRHRSPTAFVGQVRRLLEFVCGEQGAKGTSLVAKLQDLQQKGIFPGYFSQITDLLRTVGNLGAHATVEDIGTWEAELIDDFFRSVLEYVYVAPAKIRRMQTRLRQHTEAGEREP